MNKFDRFEVAVGGNDRLYYKDAVFPMGEYNTAYNFVQVTWKGGRMPVVFSGCDFENCVFDKADLRFAVFIDCTFKSCLFRRCLMSLVSMIDCRGYDLKLHYCEADEMLIMHSMIDGIRATRCRLIDSRISVNTEYLAPMVFKVCDMEGSHIQNVKGMQYESPFGIPTLSQKDRKSVKIDRCKGRIVLEGFQHVP